MNFSIHSPVKALSKAYLRHSLKREQIELLKTNLGRMFERIRAGEHEEHLKNIVSDFLKDTWYKQTNEINTSGRTDLVIHNGRNSSDTVGVLIEVKRPGNNSEMISHEKPNTKALHELLHYYMQERYIKGNMEVRRLIVCNIQEWYIFDASDFERLFFNNRKFVENYQKWSEGLFSGDKTDWLYRAILKPFVEDELETLPCTYFNLKEYERCIRGPEGEDDRKLIALYKVLSPPHLLKQSFANDANSLNREFYSELLHILGLEEIKEKGKKLITRKAPERRDEASLLENTINILKVRNKLTAIDNREQYGDTEEKQYFSLGLELCITWLNRILFLKLLEGQLRAYHRDNREYAFLNTRRIADYDELEELFFEVLARRNTDRTVSVQAKFGDIPYLNSSLFEESELERTTIHVAALKGRLELPLHGATVLKDKAGRRVSGDKNTLHYLFEFLDAYDFSSEGEAEIQEAPRTIINASVLGLIFEKINGYRDGSFFTPGFITMYICRETIRRAVVERFRASNLPGLHNLESFDELRDRLDASDREIRKRANAIINTLTVCDPAVGSGHFLVSALNELIAVKSELGILRYRDNGDKIKEYRVIVENDELIVTDKDDDRLFAYTLNKNDRPIDELQRLQETLFHEKEAIIENCLFGVDINPKSVAICRLRLWIELLKNAYYTRESGYTELETLPNIDINIKCGNSLVSRFAVSGEVKVAPADKKKMKELTEKYRRHVADYKLSTPTTATKGHLRKFIDDLKHDLEKFGTPTDKDIAELRKKENFLDQLPLFALSPKEVAGRNKLQDGVDALRKRLDVKQRTVYANAFEWRFEFPEVLDENGEFEGFDAVIGNPPYVRADAGEAHLAMRRQIMESGQFETLWEKWDLYVPFMELGFKLLRRHGVEAMIVSDGYCHAKYARKSQEWFLKNSAVSVIDFIGSLDIFEEASVHNVICLFERRNGTANRPARRLHQGEFGSVRLLATDAQRNLTHRAFFPEDAEDREFNAPVVPLAEICYISKGMVVHADEREAQGAFELSDLVADKRDDLHPKPFVEGKHLARWLPHSLRWLEWGTERAPGLFSRPTFPELYEVAEKILILRVSGREIKVAYDDGMLRCNHTAIVCVPWHRIKDVCNKSLQKVARYCDEKPRPGLPQREKLEAVSRRFSAKYLLAVMNSTTAHDFLQTIRRSNTDLYPDDWKKLPVPDVTPEQQTPLIALVDRILAAKQADPKADISTFEAEINQLVCALYGLTDEETAVAEGKQP